MLRLFYEDRIGADLLAEKEVRLTKAIATAHSEVDACQQEDVADDQCRKFDEVARILSELDIERAWNADNEVERRVLVEELLREITVLLGHLENGRLRRSPVNVLYDEVGMKESVLLRVGGGTWTTTAFVTPGPSQSILAGQIHYFRLPSNAE